MDNPVTKRHDDDTKTQKNAQWTQHGFECEEKMHQMVWMKMQRSKKKPNEKNKWKQGKEDKNMRKNKQLERKIETRTPTFECTQEFC